MEPILTVAEFTVGIPEVLHDNIKGNLNAFPPTMAIAKIELTEIGFPTGNMPGLKFTMSTRDSFDRSVHKPIHESKMSLTELLLAEVYVTRIIKNNERAAPPFDAQRKLRGEINKRLNIE